MTHDARVHLAREIFDALVGAAAVGGTHHGAPPSTSASRAVGCTRRAEAQLDDPHASVHQRSRLGFTKVGTYYSVDTGKYSVAPTLAAGLGRAIMDGD